MAPTISPERSSEAGRRPAAAPAVSIIALTRNHQRWVTGALDAIQDQTVKAVQLVVADDGSTDATPSLVEAWIARSGMDAQLVAHQSRRGICTTLNEILPLLRGEFVVIVSLDDLWAPTHLEEGLAAFAASGPGTAVVFSDVDMIDENGAPFGRRLLRDHAGMGTPGNPVPEGYIFEHLIDANFIPAASAIMRASALSEAGPYDETLAYEDYDMWLRLSARYRFAYVDKVSAQYRLHGGSFSQELRDNRQYYDTEFRLLLKARGHDPVCDRKLYRRMVRLARANYFSGHVGGREHLRTLARAELRPESALLAAMSFLPVPASALRKSRDLARAVRKRLVGRAGQDPYGLAGYVPAEASAPIELTDWPGISLGDAERGVTAVDVAPLQAEP